MDIDIVRLTSEREEARGQICAVCPRVHQRITQCLEKEQVINKLISLSVKRDYVLELHITCNFVPDFLWNTWIAT